MSSPGPMMALAFLTRIPVRADGDLAAGVKWFPVIGAGVGAAAGAVYVIGSAVAPGWLAAVLAVGCAVAVTGALHEDGLADTFDGLSSLNTVDRQLEVMRDPRLGTFGAAALTLVLVARVGLVASLQADWASMGVVAWAHGVSRAAAVGVMVSGAAPAAAGAGAVHLAGLRRLPAAIVSVSVALAGWPLVGARTAWGIVAAAGAAAVIWWWARRRLGGVTGDVLGACQQVALVAALAAAAA